MVVSYKKVIRIMRGGGGRGGKRGGGGGRRGRRGEEGGGGGKRGEEGGGGEEANYAVQIDP